MKKQSLIKKTDARVLVVMGLKIKRHEKHYRLSVLGLAPRHIRDVTGAPYYSICRDLWKYKKGKLKMTYEK